MCALFVTILLSGYTGSGDYYTDKQPVIIQFCAILCAYRSQGIAEWTITHAMGLQTLKHLPLAIFWKIYNAFALSDPVLSNECPCNMHLDNETAPDFRQQFIISSAWLRTVAGVITQDPTITRVSHSSGSSAASIQRECDGPPTLMYRIPYISSPHDEIAPDINLLTSKNRDDPSRHSDIPYTGIFRCMGSSKWS